MKVVAMMGGLGSQMFKYAFYLEIKKCNQEVFIDTIPFFLEKMWNGYELERIFGISEPDIVNFLTQNEVDNMERLKKNYLFAAYTAMNKQGDRKKIIRIYRGECYTIKHERVLDTILKYYNTIKKISHGNKNEDTFPRYYSRFFSYYFDEFEHISDKYIGKGYNKELLKKVFTFPTFTDEKNRAISLKMKQEESVAIHIRRSDHLYDNGRLFQNNYFVKATNFIKENVKKPVYYIFSDDLEWCRKNLKRLGLDLRDDVFFINWNKGMDSYRDMQLMTFCKHNILPISSFSWWGYYLSVRADKVVCAPKGYWLEIINHF